MDQGRYSRERWRAHRAVHKAERRALEAAYLEIQRRLKDLNHAHRQMQGRDQLYVREDTYRQTLETLTEKIDLVNAGLIELRAASGGTQEAREGSRALWALMIAAVAAFASVAAVVLVALH